MAIKNIHMFELKKGERQSHSPKHFRLVKLSLEWLLLSRAILRFALQFENINNVGIKKMKLLTIIHKY